MRSRGRGLAIVTAAGAAAVLLAALATFRGEILEFCQRMYWRLEGAKGVAGLVIREDGTKGLAVESVAAGGPGARANLKEEDIIVALDGTEVETIEDLHALLSGRCAGETVRLTVERKGGVRIDVPLVLAPRLHD